MTDTIMWLATNAVELNDKKWSEVTKQWGRSLFSLLFIKYDRISLGAINSFDVHIQTEKFCGTVLLCLVDELKLLKL